MLVGMGGTTAELFKDNRLEFPPLNERLARQMLQSLQIYPLLTGYRGSKPKNINKLIEAIIRLSYLAADYPEIEELDINPILVSPDEELLLIMSLLAILLKITLIFCLGHIPRALWNRPN